VEQESERMIAEILKIMMCVLLILVLVGFILFGYYYSYEEYKEYRTYRKGAGYPELFFSVMLFMASTGGVLVCLYILADAMGW
jgi:TRAP-type C4-dicarboxylate transport system permease small subunit